MQDIKKHIIEAALLKMRYEDLHKGDDPLKEHYLMYPATINGQTHNPESGLKYHVTLRSLGDIPPHIPTMESRLKDTKAPPKEFGVVPHKFIKPTGEAIHVLRLTPKTPELNQAHEALTSTYGPDKFPQYVPHITIGKELWDQVHSQYPNHQLNIQIHPLELWQGDKVLWQKEPHQLKIAKSENNNLFPTEHILNHLGATDPHEGGNHIKSRIAKHPKWQLKNIDINSIYNHADQSANEPMQGNDYGESDEEVASEYAQQPSHTVPHLILERHPNGDYMTIDGAHRLRAAYLRGDKTVNAFVPLESINKTEGDDLISNHPVITKQPHFIFSISNPLYPNHMDKTLTPDKVKQQLHDSGERFEEVNGKYGAPEKSIIVFNPKNVDKLHILASRLGQESAIHSNGNAHQMYFYHGDNKGKTVPGRGTEFFNEMPEDNYTELKINGKPLFFRHNIDMGQAKTAHRAHPHSYDWHDPIDEFGKSESLTKAPTLYDLDEDGDVHPNTSYPNITKTLKRQALPNGLIHVIKKDPKAEDYFHFLQDPKTKQKLATMHIENRRSEYGDEEMPTVSHSAVFPAYKGKGYGKQLYIAALHHHGQLQSDDSVSRNANKLWNKMGKKPGMDVELAGFPNDPRPHTAQAYHNLLINRNFPKTKKSEDSLPNLIHFSRHPEKLASISPEFHGTGAPGAEKKQGIRVPKSYYYEEGTQPEALVTSGAHHMYTVKHPGNVVDIASDEVKPLVDKSHIIDHNGQKKFDIHTFEQNLKNHGYAGYKNSNSSLPNAVALFHEQPVMQHHPMHKTDDSDMSYLDFIKYPIGARQNFNIKEGLDKAVHPHVQAHGPKPVNDQAGGNQEGQFHNIMGQYGTVNPGTKTNLKFYNNIEHHEPKIDQHLMGEGYSTYFAGGKHGIPDLKNKNYNTKQLMIYDPTPESGGDFGDEAYTRTWRKAHEKAHADTYPEINSIYGEGRRLGKLGVRSPKEMKRAVHWEWLAAHRQRDLMQQMGQKISDPDFHKELNTIMGDAVHRAITGKFTEPSDMGFHPHSHKVPLETALQAVDAHAKSLGLRHDDDTFLKQKQEGLRMTERAFENKLRKIETARKIKDLNIKDTSHENRAIIDSEELEKGMVKTGLNFVTALSMLGVPSTLAARTVHGNKAAVSMHKKIENPDLNAIRFIESSNGKNFNHKQVTHGLNAGATAIGSYGMMPITIAETVTKNPKLGVEHPELTEFDPKSDEPQMRQAIQGRKDLEDKLATAHWSRLMNKFNGDSSKAAYAWKNGITGALQATPEDIANHPYVKQFNKIKKLQTFSNKAEGAKHANIGTQDAVKTPNKPVKISDHDVLLNSPHYWKDQK